MFATELTCCRGLLIDLNYSSVSTVESLSPIHSPIQHVIVNTHIGSLLRKVYVEYVYVEYVHVEYVHT